MGYYSEIGIVIEEEFVQEFLTELKLNIEDRKDDKLKKEINDLLSDSVQFYEENQKGDMLIYIEQIKWNNSRELEQLITSALFKIGETNFRFIRLGEDVDDNETFGEYYSNQFNLEWYREILFNPSCQVEEEFKLFD